MASQPHTNKSNHITKYIRVWSALWWRPYNTLSSYQTRFLRFSKATCLIITMFLYWFFQICFQISLPMFSERQWDRFSLESSPQANLNPGRDVNNFPSLYFPPPFVAVLVLSCCLLFCSSGALRGDLICASLLNPRSQNNIVFIWPK